MDDFEEYCDKGHTLTFQDYKDNVCPECEKRELEREFQHEAEEYRRYYPYG